MRRRGATGDPGSLESGEPISPGGSQRAGATAPIGGRGTFLTGWVPTPVVISLLLALLLISSATVFVERREQERLRSDLSRLAAFGKKIAEEREVAIALSKDFSTQVDPDATKSVNTLQSEIQRRDRQFNSTLLAEINALKQALREKDILLDKTQLTEDGPPSTTASFSSKDSTSSSSSSSSSSSNAATTSSSPAAVASEAVQSTNSVQSTAQNPVDSSTTKTMVATAPSKKGVSETAQQILNEEVPYNPLLPIGNDQLPHHPAIRHFLPAWRGAFDGKYLVDWLGVKTLEPWDCGGHNGGYLKFVPSRRIPCQLHKERKAGGVRGVVQGYLPLVDDEYPEYVDMLEAVMAAGDHFVIAELGARYATWAVRGVAAYRKINPQGKFTMLAVEPSSIKPAEQHATANSIPLNDTILLQMYIKSSEDLAEVLSKADHFDFLDLDCQGGERTAFDDPNVINTLNEKVRRLHVGTHGQDIHADLQILFLSLGWIPTMNFVRNPRYHQCDNTVSEEENSFMVSIQSCTSPTPYGPIYVRDGLLGFINPRYASEEDKKRAPNGSEMVVPFPFLGRDILQFLPQVSTWVYKLLGTIGVSDIKSVAVATLTENSKHILSRAMALSENVNVKSAPPSDDTEAESSSSSRKGLSDVKDQIVASKISLLDKGNPRILRDSGTEAAVEIATIESLPKGEYYCQSVTVSGAPRKGNANPPEASFKYCNINYKVGCKNPPCIDEGTRTQWPPVLFAKFFLNHVVEKQITDIFLKTLDKEHSSDQFVFDIGSNAGWFTTLAGTLGYEVHAVDVQPFCSQHVYTNSLENNIDSRVHVHNIGLSSTPGTIQMPLVLCKGGLSFNVSEADVTKQIMRHGKLVTQAKVPLSKLEDFVDMAIGPGNKIRMMKMDTEGSEIDILKSGMSLFESKRVQSFVVEVTPFYPGGRSWEEVKGVSLEEGLALLKKLTTLFDHTYGLYDHHLPSSPILDNVPAADVPLFIRAPLFKINDMDGYIDDRIKKEQNCNIWFFND